MDNVLAEDMKAAEREARYDQACKKVLSHKSILAWILKTCADEYKDYSVAEIAEKYIEEPEVGETPMRPDQTNRIHGDNTEDGSLTESTVHYDILFHASVPGDAESRIGLIVNIEAQNRYDNGYPLVKRGLYYCSRMISSQYGVVFDKAHYENIKKVYSVWICMNVPDPWKNTITEYRIQESNRFGTAKEAREHYDILKTVMIGLGDEALREEQLLRLLNVLFSKEMVLSRKKDILSEEFDLPMTVNMEEGVEDMCNLGQGIREESFNEGKFNGIVRILDSIMGSLHISFDEAADIAKLSPEERAICKAILAKK